MVHTKSTGFGSPTPMSSPTAKASRVPAPGVPSATACQVDRSLSSAIVRTQQRGSGRASVVSGRSSVMVAAPLRGSGLQRDDVSHHACMLPKANRKLPYTCLPLLPLLSSSSSGLSLPDSFLGRSQMAIWKAKVRVGDQSCQPLRPVAALCLSLWLSRQHGGLVPVA